MDFGLKYFIPPPDGRYIMQEYQKPTISVANSWYVLFSAPIPEKTALVIRSVYALCFEQISAPGSGPISQFRISLLLHEGTPTIDGNQKLNSVTYRESARLFWPVPFTRNTNFALGEPCYHKFTGPIVVGSENNRHALICLWSGDYPAIFNRAGANVDAWMIPDPENLWKGNL